MDSTQAQKLMPVHLDLSTFVTAILSNTDITDKIGTRLTMNPPNKGETPYLFFTASEPTQKKTDDIQSILFRHFLTWRLVAPSSWTQTEMRELMEIVMFELQKFQGTTVPAKTL